MKTARPILLATLCGAALGLGACGGRKDAANATAPATPQAAGMTGGDKPAVAPGLTLADGPDVCFRAVGKQIGADTKVSEITSFFSVGSDIDADDTEPKGQLKVCTVQYQSPTDPRKLVEATMDLPTGKFGAPHPVEITVTGGDEANFRLDDYIVPLSKVNAAGLTSIMDAKKAQLGSYYGKYAYSGVRLESPDAFSSTNMLRLDVTGRLASNDIKKDGYASVMLDGKTVKTDYLTK